jgi:UDP-N-acetylglucosamine 4-epimerase
MKSYQEVLAHCHSNPQTWLVTGAAGFIGSNLLESLLKLDQIVIGLDNFATGHKRNLEEVRELVSPTQWARFRFIEGGIENLASCRSALKGVDYVLHHAALGSVPASINDPVLCNLINISGFVNMLVASRDAKVKRFVYAASSSTYGDEPTLPKVEDNIGRPLSPYAVTKYVNELYADVFARCYGVESIGLRYFNIFGPRQDPEGAYAAVIPKWISSMILHQPVSINGDGKNTRDFCYVDTVVQANILAATTENPEAINQIYNIALGEKTSLNQLYSAIKSLLGPSIPHLSGAKPVHLAPRFGDVVHSQADISKAKKLLGFDPKTSVHDGLKTAMSYYIKNGRD